MTAPPWPGSSMPPLCQVGPQPERLFDRGAPAFAHAADAGARIGGEPVDVVEREPGIGDRVEARVDGERERVDHQPPADRRTTDARQHRAVLVAVVVHRRTDRRVLRLGDALARVGLPGRLEERDPDVVVLLEADGDLLADVHVVGVAADDVGRQADAGVLGERDDRDRVGRLEAGEPLVAVDRRADDGRTPRDHRRFPRAAPALRADGGRRVDEGPAVGAALDPQLPVGARRPEPLARRGELGERSGRALLGHRFSYLGRAWARQFDACVRQTPAPTRCSRCRDERFRGRARTRSTQVLNMAASRRGRRAARPGRPVEQMSQGGIGMSRSRTRAGRWVAVLAALVLVSAIGTPIASAQQDDKFPAVDQPGVTDDEIRVGGDRHRGGRAPPGPSYASAFDGVEGVLRVHQRDRGRRLRARARAVVRARRPAREQPSTRSRALISQDDVFAALPIAVQLFTGADLLAEEGIPTFGWDINEEWGSENNKPGPPNFFGGAGSFICFTCAQPERRHVAREEARPQEGRRPRVQRGPVVGLCGRAGEQLQEVQDRRRSSSPTRASRSAAPTTPRRSRRWRRRTSTSSSSCIDGNGAVNLAREMEKQQLDATMVLPNAYNARARRGERRRASTATTSSRRSRRSRRTRSPRA